MVIHEHSAPGTQITLVATPDDAHQRLDLFLSQKFSRYSRSYFKRLIDEGCVTVNQRKAKSSWEIKPEDQVEILFPALPEAHKDLQPFDDRFGVQIIAQEPDFLVLCKPAGLMVHKPNEYSTQPTLVDWLIASYETIANVGIADRPGIIHRLDKDTSGLLIIPLTNEAFGNFGELFRTRKINKLYWALVYGHPEPCGVIDFSIGRDPTRKHRMIHQPSSGISRSALTSYKVLAYYDTYSLVEVRIVTGRTHQIRVHFAAIGHPVVGDTVYGKKSLLIDRQALHAKQLSFCYQAKQYVFDASPASDMQRLIEAVTK